MGWIADVFWSVEPEVADPLRKAVAARSRDQGGTTVYAQAQHALSADNRHGGDVAVGPAATEVLVSFTVAAGGIRLAGFNVGGDVDAALELRLDGEAWYYGRLSTQDRAPKVVLPNPHEVAAGVLVELVAINAGGSSGTLRGTVLAE